MRDLDKIQSRVLSAAREVLREDGYAADLVEIARRANVGVATIYRRWKSKEQLIREIVGDMASYTYPELHRVAAECEDAREAVRGAMKIGFWQVKEYGWLAIETVTTVHPESFRDLYPGGDLERFFGSLINRGKEQGHFSKDLDTRVAVKFWRALVSQNGLGELLEEGYPLDEISEQATRFLLAGLQFEKSVKT